MTIAAHLGGHWERLDAFASDNLTAGYTREFTVDGSKFAMARFTLSFVGQSLNLNINGNARCWGAFNFNKHDGTSSRGNIQNITNQVHNLLNKGTGGLSGVMIPKRTIDGNVGTCWMVVMNAYAALDNAGGWVAAGGDYWRLDGKIAVTNQTATASGWNMRFGFSSYAGQAGAVNFKLEGMRR